MRRNALTVIILLAHAASTLYLTGTVWFAQVVHFPLFARVGSDEFLPYLEAHSRAFGWIIWPALALNALTLVALACGLRPSGLPRVLVLVDVVLFAVTAASTAGLQVPRLIALGRGFDQARFESLVATNWVRTTSQTLAGLLVLLMLASLLVDEAGS